MKDFALQTLLNFAEQNNLTLLYASLFGSVLYGTNTEDSDVDIKGIFLPKKNDLLLEKSAKGFSYNSGGDHSRNTKDDVDIEVWSLHNFLNMIERGDTGALDLLFSYTNSDAVLYCDDVWKDFINNVEYLFNPINTRAFIGYCLGQIKRYNLKGKQLFALENLMAYVDNLVQNNPSIVENKHKVKVYYDDILKNCAHGTYVMEDFATVTGRDTKNIRALRVLGSVHLEEITVTEFQDRLKTTYNRYGVRAHSAKEADGVDWKAVSHGLRVAKQAEDLLLTGQITFPLPYAKDILAIKQGTVDFEEVTERLNDQVARVDYLLSHLEQIVENKFNRSVVEKLILSRYK